MMKKWRINWRTVARNLFALTTIIVVAIVVHKLATQGFSSLSTIGYFD